MQSFVFTIPLFIPLSLRSLSSPSARKFLIRPLPALHLPRLLAPLTPLAESLPDSSTLPSQAVMNNDAEDPDLKDGSQAGMANSSNDYEYGCRIVEEPMSAAHEG